MLVAFGLGAAVGLRFGQRPVIGEAVPQSPASGPQELAGANPPACVDIRDAGRLTGQSGCVTGLVLHVYAARSGNTFLDFCANYRDCPFSSVIFASDKSNFGDLGSLQGRRIEVRGDIVAYQGRAEIIIHDPKQIRRAQ